MTQIFTKQSKTFLWLCVRHFCIEYQTVSYGKFYLFCFFFFCFVKAWLNKLCIRETQNPTACAVSSTDTFKKCHLSCVMCHRTHTQTATATDPPLCNFITIHRWVLCKDPKTFFLNLKKSFWKKFCLLKSHYYQCALWPEVSSPLKSIVFEVLFTHRHTDTHTYIKT